MRVGSHNLYSEDPDQADIAVSKVVNHEDYDSWTISNDICMLYLDGSADLDSPVIDIIAIPPSPCPEYPPGTMCTVSGWGTTSEGGSLASQLMKVTIILVMMMMTDIIAQVDVPIVSVEDCRDAYG